MLHMYDHSLGACSCVAMETTLAPLIVVTGVLMDLDGRAFSFRFEAEGSNSTCV